MRWDVVVVGAGAAGLLAATRSAERGRRTLLLEKNRKPGVKILMSGGTRCNLTHATDARGIVAAFGPQGKFLHSALAALGPQGLVELIEAEGVPTKVELTGKIFPVSNKATDVLAALLRRLERSGAILALGEPLQEVAQEFEANADGFRLVTSQRTLLASKVIVTTGGQSYPGCGTTGDGYRWLAKLGHAIVPPRPALVPLNVETSWVKALQGITVPDACVTVVEPSTSPPIPPSPTRRGGLGGEVLAVRRGSFLFTHFGVSGPAVLDVSRMVTGHPLPESLQLECDFLPVMEEAALTEWLRQESISAGRRQLSGVLGQHVPHRLAESLLAQAGMPEDRRAAGLTREERGPLVQAVKRQRISISGTLGFKKAEVTAGGVRLDEVDSRDMRSKLVPGLFIAGEVLDLDGPIGGYNFQAAFSTGWLAGSSA
jgi:predicted Rossmann fold flavoprotein